MAPVIAVTSGEPAGIGPDICLSLAEARLPARIVVLGDRGLLQVRAAALRINVKLLEYGTPAPGALEVMHVPLRGPCTPGKLDAANSPYVLELLDRAFDGCVAGDFDAMVTAPVQKSVINDAGIAFTGHTEYLAERAANAHVVMMLTGAGLRVALATTHLALKDVSSAITRSGLEQTLRVLFSALKRDFGLRTPRVIVAGLNPHGGEGGYLGREEIEVIEPVLAKLRAEGFDLLGPLPADTLFNPKRLEGSDAVLAMYHDQGLPVLKFASFGEGINVTLGLPIVRTSVDHGTALDLAGTGRAEPGSLFAATALAIDMANSRKKSGAAALR
jgi:4-hydroxythreonine-4-phosphate dehydrogenase